MNVPGRRSSSQFLLVITWSAARDRNTLHWSNVTHLYVTVTPGPDRGQTLGTKRQKTLVQSEFDLWYSCTTGFSYIRSVTGACWLARHSSRLLLSLRLSPSLFLPLHQGVTPMITPLPSRPSLRGIAVVLSTVEHPENCSTSDQRSLRAR